MIRRMAGVALLVCSTATGAQLGTANETRAAYEFAHRCFVVTSGFRDEAGSRRSYDAAMRLGRLQDLSNRQLNADFDRFTASETGRLARDPRYRNQLIAECRVVGLAS